MDANFVILALFALGLAGRCTTMVAYESPQRPAQSGAVDAAAWQNSAE